MDPTVVPFDAASYFGKTEAQAELLDDALRSGDPAYIREALSVIARARGLDRDGSELGRASTALASGGELPLSALLDVAKELGVQLQIHSIAAE